MAFYLIKELGYDQAGYLRYDVFCGCQLVAKNKLYPDALDLVAAHIDDADLYRETGMSVAITGRAVREVILLL